MVSKETDLIQIEENAVNMIAESSLPPTKPVPMEYVSVTEDIKYELKLDASQEAELIIQFLQRDINILNDATQSRFTKRKSLEKIQSETIQKTPQLDADVMAGLLIVLLPVLLKICADPVEKARETSVRILKRIPNVAGRGLLRYVVEMLVKRLGTLETVEASEEIRLLLVQLMNQIATLAGT
ncbi:HEAT repeat-containing protein 2, partial [Nowakowskiella sp. JEL0078]